MRLTGYGFRQQSLTCSRRSYEQCALRNLSAQVRILLRRLEEGYDFFQFFLGPIQSCDISEVDLGAFALFEQLCL